MNISRSQFFTGVIILVSWIYIFNLHTHQGDYESEIATLEQELQNAKEDDVLYEKTETFISDLNKSSHEDMLTGQALRDYEKALEESQDQASNLDSPDTLKRTKTYNVHVQTTGDDTKKSYAIYEMVHNTGGSAASNRRYRTYLSIIIDWVKEEDTYKVEDYSIQQLQDDLGGVLTEGQ